MPWTKADVDRHIKGLSDHQKDVWVAAANNALKEYGDDGKAIATANAAAQKASKDAPKDGQRTVDASAILDTPHAPGEPKGRKPLPHRARGRTPQAMIRAFKPELKDNDLPQGVIGRVGGIALVYDVVDDRGTVFDPGCLVRTAKERVARGKVKLFWDHGDVLDGGYYDTDCHIGTVRTLQDIDLPDGQRGAYMEADLFDTEKGRQAHEYLKSVVGSGGETGLSIGMLDAKHYRGTLPNGEQGTRFAEVALREITITAESSVPGTVVTGVRQGTMDDSAAADALDYAPSSDPNEPRGKRLLRYLMSSLDPSHVEDCVRDWLGTQNRNASPAATAGAGTVPAKSDDQDGDSGKEPDADADDVTRAATPEQRATALRSTYARAS